MAMYEKNKLVKYRGVYYRAKRDIDDAAYCPPRSENWEELKSNADFTFITPEREILTEICNDAISCICNDYQSSPWVHRLKAWWEANKPKSDREIKLEKIQSIISHESLSLEQQSEEILKLLGE